MSTTTNATNRSRRPMKVGLHVPQLGRFADPQLTARVAVEAEQAGFASLWAIDRLLSPIAPRSAYPATADGALPDEQHTALDPIVTLTVAATVTEQIRIGTDVLVAPWYPPVLLARSLATLDRVSRGRLTVGMGLGWSVDEYEAVGAPMKRRGERLDEILDVMSALWQDTSWSLETSRESVAPAHLVALPVQRPQPPILLAAFTQAGLDRIARRADGWIPTALPLDVVAAMWASVLDTAERLGRDHTRLQLVVLADVKLTATALGNDRPPFNGSWDQVVDDIAVASNAGATELIISLQSTARDTSELMDIATRLARAVDLTPATAH